MHTARLSPHLNAPRRPWGTSGYTRFAGRGGLIQPCGVRAGPGGLLPGRASPTEGDVRRLRSFLLRG
eukprot:5305226-Prymnesium_polylepis.1